MSRSEGAKLALDEDDREALTAVGLGVGIFMMRPVSGFLPSGCRYKVQRAGTSELMAWFLRPALKLSSASLILLKCHVNSTTVPSM